MSDGFRVELRRRFVCESCGKSYASRSGVKGHLPCWKTAAAKGCETCAHKTLHTFEVNSELGPTLHAENRCASLGSVLKRFERDCPVWQAAGRTHLEVVA